MISNQEHQQEHIVDSSSPSKNISLPLSSLGLYRHIGRNQKQIYSLLCDNREAKKFVGKEKEIVKYFNNISSRTSSIKKFINQFQHTKDTAPTTNGEYNFFNYVSKAKIFCQVSQNPFARIAQLIFLQDYKQALQKLKQDDIPMQINLRRTLIVILEGYRKLNLVINDDPDLTAIYLHRKNFLFPNFTPPPQKDRSSAARKEEIYRQKKFERETPWIYNVTDLHQFAKKLKKSLRLQQRANYIYRNVIKLQDFLKYISKKQNDDYLDLIMYYLSNTENQTTRNGYYEILLKSQGFVITDRLNYAQILLNPQQRKRFVNEVQNSMLKMTNLTNLLMFPLDQQDSYRFQLILQNYLDQTGDLQTIAWICLSYENRMLVKYIDMYLQKLTLSHQQEEAEKLEYEKTIRLDGILAKTPYKIQKIHGLFMENVGVENEKIDLSGFIKSTKKDKNKSFLKESQLKQKAKTCYICFKQRVPDMNNQQSFIECSRCKHGGHLSHILKWYQQTRMCPKNDCPCQCN